MRNNTPLREYACFIFFAANRFNETISALVSIKDLCGRFCIAHTQPLIKIRIGFQGSPNAIAGYSAATLALARSPIDYITRLNINQKAFTFFDPTGPLWMWLCDRHKEREIKLRADGVSRCPSRQSALKQQTR